MRLLDGICPLFIGWSEMQTFCASSLHCEEMLVCGPLIALTIFGVFVLGLYLGKKWGRLSQLESQQQELIFRPSYNCIGEEGEGAELDVFENGQKEIIFLAKFGAKAHLFPSVLD